MSTWPQRYIPSTERRPAHIGTKRTTNGRYIAAPISAQARQLCRRQRMTAVMPMVMFVAMTRAMGSGRSRTADQPTASKATFHSGCRATMPTSIATTIST